MKQRKAYKFKLKAEANQKALFRRRAGCCRFVWNKALALQKERLDAGERVLRYVEVAKLLTGWKMEEGTAFLAEAPVHALQQTLKFLDQALREAFNKKNPKRFPVFKKKGLAVDSFRHPDGFKLDNDRIYLPKIGWVGFIKSREIRGNAQEYNRVSPGRALVCLDSDRAGDCGAGASGDCRRGHRPGRCQVRHPVGRLVSGAVEQLQANRETACQGTAEALPQDQILCQLAEAEGQNHQAPHQDCRCS